MASNYEVNIKLDTKQAKNQLRELEERITKLNRMALSGKASKQALATDKEKLKLTNLELKNDLALIKVKEGELKLDRQSLLLEKQKSKAVAGTNKQLKQVNITQDKIRNPKAIGPSSPLTFTNEGTRIPGPGFVKGKGIAASALISGSFPLLFGQGIPGAIAGGLGGGLGAKFGGQMGGFAGGLVATAVLQTFNNIKDAVNQFGAELNDPTKNLDALTARIKKFDKSIEISVSTLKNAGLDQVAGELASLTMQQRFEGLDSVKNLNKEIVKFQQGAADLATRLSILVAGPLTFLFKTLNLIGGSANKVASELTTSEAVQEQKTALKAQLEAERILVKRLADAEKRLAEIPRFKIGDEIETKFEISAIEKSLKLTRENIKDNERLLKIRKLQREILLSEGELLEGQINLQIMKADVRQGNINEKAVAIEQKRIDMMKIENKLLVERENLRSMEENEVSKPEIETQKEKIKNLERELELTTLIGDERINAADPAISRMDELNRKMRDLNDTTLQAVNLSKAMGESFEESFKGVIKGTMTVTDAFRNMLNRIADFFLDTAAQLAATQLQRSILGLFGNMFNFSTFRTTPMNDIQGTVMEAANGGPVGMRRPYLVGEKGPELFVPNQSGNIIPNHDLAGIGGGSTGSSVEGNEEQGRELGRLISVAIQSELINQKRPGGLLA